MEEENLQPEVTTETKVEQQKEETYDDMPKLEDLLKSEQELKSAAELKGLKQVEDDTVQEYKTFTRKEDEKKVFVKKRLKLLTGVYVAVLSLLLLFVGANAITLINTNREINNRTIEIQREEGVVQGLEQGANDVGTPMLDITLNEPRDYNDDTRGLSFMDKLIILFRNLFG